MKAFRTVFMLVAILLCSFTNRSQARVMAGINYQKEFNESDLVVIATPTSQTTNTNERSLVLDVSRQSKDGKQVRAQSIGVETPFGVSLVLKGDKALKKFTLHHYRVDLDPKTVMVNGPFLVFFRMPSDFGPSEPRKLNSYLLFLVREADGRYAPSGGQNDAGYRAIHPLPFEPN